MAGQGLGVVVEVDEQRFAEAGFDEAVGMPIEGGVEWFAGQVPTHVLDQHLAFEVGDRSRLGGGDVGCITDHEDVGRRLGLQGVLIGGDEVELVTKTRGPSDIGGSSVERDDDGQVEAHLAAVVGNETTPFPSTSPVLNSVTSSMPFSANIPASRLDATGLVKAPSSGVT